MFGTVYLVGRQERLSYEHKTCLVQQEGRVQGNIRADHLLLVEEAIINSNQKAQAEIPSYKYPKEIDELAEGPRVVLLPEINC